MEYRSKPFNVQKDPFCLTVFFFQLMYKNLTLILILQEVKYKQS